MRKSAFNKSYIVPILIAAAVVIGVGIALAVGDTNSGKSGTGSKSACGAYRNDLSVTIARQNFKTELAKTQQERENGLGGRPCIQDDQAMLFSFNKPGQYKFWMKDMKFPIDILWINSDRQVVGIELDVNPSTYHSKYPFFENDPQHPAQFVLELKANRAKDLKVTQGTKVIF